MLINNYQKLKLDKIINDIEKIEAGGNHGQLPVLWKSAKDSYVTDEFGNKYLDFTSTIFVTNAGHGNISRAIIKQAKELIHSYTFPTTIKWQFLKKFKAFLPSFCDKIFLASAGSEVASWAIKLMRNYRKRPLIVHIDGAFHGKTGHVANLDHEEIKIPFEFENPYDFEQVLLELQKNVDNIAGIMIETYQGWSAKFMNKGYVKALIDFAKANDIPVCFDEIQGGFYRTGKKFAYEWYDVEPDLICMGKGLGNGLPISALAGREKYFNIEGLSSTHSGNPLCCAGASLALDIYNKIDMFELNIKSDLLHDTLKMLCNSFNSVLKETHGKGLIASLICNNKEIADKICNLAKDKGLLLVRTGKESIKIGPPLIIEGDELVKGLDILEECIKECIC